MSPPAELVWRAVGIAPADPSRLRVRDDAAPAANASAARGGFAHAADIPPHQRNEGAHAMSLEPALMDRLADDVIRRVERRIRIERERRGV